MSAPWLVGRKGNSVGTGTEEGDEVTRYNISLYLVAVEDSDRFLLDHPRILSLPVTLAQVVTGTDSKDVTMVEIPEVKLRYKSVGLRKIVSY